VLETGVAFEREESTPGLLCVAAPVFETDGHTTIAAISVTGPVGRFRPESHETAVRVASVAEGSYLAAAWRLSLRNGPL
jgi:DNA-binding IclR family transcriptional regulator